MTIAHPEDSIKQTKNEKDKKNKQVIESSEYTTFQNALASVLKVSHSELAIRINQAKRQPSAHAANAKVK